MVIYLIIPHITFITVIQSTCATCPAPPQVIGSRHDATLSTYNANATILYTCKSGFILEEPSPLRVCLQNGSWTGPDSPCQISMYIFVYVYFVRHTRYTYFDYTARFMTLKLSMWTELHVYFQCHSEVPTSHSPQ